MLLKYVAIIQIKMLEYDLLGTYYLLYIMVFTLIWSVYKFKVPEF